MSTFVFLSCTLFPPPHTLSSSLTSLFLLFLSFGVVFHKCYHVFWSTIIIIRAVCCSVALSVCVCVEAEVIFQSSFMISFDKTLSSRNCCCSAYQRLCFTLSYLSASLTEKISRVRFTKMGCSKSSHELQTEVLLVANNNKPTLVSSVAKTLFSPSLISITLQPSSSSTNQSGGGCDAWFPVASNAILQDDLFPLNKSQLEAAPLCTTVAESRGDNTSPCSMETSHAHLQSSMRAQAGDSFGEMSNSDAPLFDVIIV